MENLKPSRKPRREVWWLDLGATSHTLKSIGRGFEDRLNWSLLSSSNSPLRHIRSLKDDDLRQNLHQCPGYLREEITLTCDLSKSVIVSHAFPGPSERCSICHQLVQYHHLPSSPSSQPLEIMDEMGSDVGSDFINDFSFVPPSLRQLESFFDYPIFDAVAPITSPPLPHPPSYNGSSYPYSQLSFTGDDILPQDFKFPSLMSEYEPSDYDPDAPSLTSLATADLANFTFELFDRPSPAAAVVDPTFTQSRIASGSVTHPLSVSSFPAGAVTSSPTMFGDMNLSFTPSPDVGKVVEDQYMASPSVIGDMNSLFTPSPDVCKLIEDQYMASPPVFSSLTPSPDVRKLIEDQYMASPPVFSSFTQSPVFGKAVDGMYKPYPIPPGLPHH